MEEPARWGPWAAPCPIRREDLARAKEIRRRKSRIDQRTRERLPALPALVVRVHAQARAAAQRLHAAATVGHGQPFTSGSELLHRAPLRSTSTAKVWTEDPVTGVRRDLSGSRPLAARSLARAALASSAAHRRSSLSFQRLGVTSRVAALQVSVPSQSPRQAPNRGPLSPGRAPVPLIATNHFMPDNLLAYTTIPARAHHLIGRLAWWDFSRTFNHADQVTTPTPTAAALIASTRLRPPVRAISCGIDLTRFGVPGADQRRSAAGKFGLPNKLTLLFVGRLDQEKHLHELIAALPGIRHRLDAQLVLAGAGTQRDKLQTQAQMLGVEEHVHFLGFVPDADLPSVYATGDVFAMPGIAELQSLVTLEAMASGLPVIAADAMALPHLVRPGVNGYLYQPGDITALSKHASHLLGTPLLRRAMGKASRALAETHDDDATFAHFEALYTGHLNPTHPLAKVPTRPGVR